MTSPTDDDLLAMASEITGFEKTGAVLWEANGRGFHPLSDLNAAFLVAMASGFDWEIDGGEAVVYHPSNKAGHSVQIERHDKAKPASAARALLVAIWKARKP